MTVRGIAAHRADRRAQGWSISRDGQSAERLLEISRMIAQSPALLAREQQILARYTNSLARVIADDTRATADDPRPAVTAAALLGIHRAVIEHVRRHILAGE